MKSSVPTSKSIRQKQKELVRRVSTPLALAKRHARQKSWHVGKARSILARFQENLRTVRNATRPRAKSLSSKEILLEDRQNKDEIAPTKLFFHYAERSSTLKKPVSTKCSLRKRLGCSLPLSAQGSEEKKAISLNSDITK